MSFRSLALLVVAITACSEDPEAAAVTAPASGAKITAQGWPSGTRGVVRLHRNPAWEEPLGEFAVDASGRFTYALGEPAELLPMSSAEGVTISPPDARFQVVAVAMTLLEGDESPTGELHIGNRLFETIPSAGDTLGQLVYVDRDVTITGAAGGCTYDESFRRGWNYELLHVISSEPYACTYTSAPHLPEGLGWYYEHIGI